MEITPLKIEYFRKENGYKQYLLKKDLLVKSGAKVCVIVPCGFKTDLYTIPFPLNKIFKNDLKYAESAIVHDFLYSSRTNRYTADRIFLLCMEYQKMPFWKRYLFYFAVRIFGVFYYYY